MYFGNVDREEVSRRWNDLQRSLKVKGNDKGWQYIRKKSFIGSF